jgi:predicted NACHT family NTPase
MAKRSLKLSEQGKQQVFQALEQSGQSKLGLAKQLGMARDTVQKFFGGKNITEENFLKLCNALGVDSRQVEELSVNLDELVQQVREKIKPFIIERCGTMRILDMPKPVPLKDIYVNVGIYESITGRRPKGIDELMDEYKKSGVLPTRKSEPQIDGLAAAKQNFKQVVLGRPGCGKTMYLKFLSLECINGNFKDNLVPFFVTLRSFAEAHNQPDLLDFISQMISTYEVTNTEIYELLKDGKCLILLDGLDEIKKNDYSGVINAIQNFCESFPKNQFIITCRIAALEYSFPNFREVEIAAFNEQQIETFVKNWFKVKNDSEKAEKFLDKLQNKRNKRINAMVANPLTLTLLCRLCEDSLKFDFPESQFELYKQAMDTVLHKWDASRNIERDDIYKNFGLTRKRDLFSYIAYETFRKEQLFFEKQVVEDYINDYIENLPDAESEAEDLKTSSEKILRSIEAQYGVLVEQARGIYSFSHIAFHEYFTARHIIYTPDPDQYKKIAKDFISHITDDKWREVFIIAVGLAKSGAYLLGLMKQKIDDLVAKDEKIQERLRWVKEQSDSIDLSQINKGTNKLVAIRAFFLDIDLKISIERELGYELDLKTTCIFSFAIILTRILGREKFDLAYTIKVAEKIIYQSKIFSETRELDPPIILSISRFYAVKCLLEYDKLCSKKRREFEELLKQKAPSVTADDSILTEWWKHYGPTWNDKLKCILMSNDLQSYYDQNWSFSAEQEELLDKYYYANLLLAECLKKSYLSPKERKEIKDTMLLPYAELRRPNQKKRLLRRISQRM